MNKRIISYKLQNYLALIPFLGFLIIWFIAWLNIYRSTKSKAYVLLHFILWCIPMLITAIAFALISSNFIIKISTYALYIISILITLYFCLLIWALSALGIEKGIIERYNKKQMI